jgi:hypothetical protein
MTRGHWLAIALFIIAAVALACSRRETTEEVDVELMAFLSQARALHHQANLKEEAGDVAAAAAAMRRLVHAQRPHDGKAPEFHEVLADSYARLGELELKRGALAAASEAITTGLTHAPEQTYFRGHLIEVQGLIEEARATELADGGKVVEAVHAREKAIQLLEEVVRIQEHVIQRSLSARDAAEPAR